jgi:hypothetical protein
MDAEAPLCLGTDITGCGGGGVIESGSAIELRRLALDDLERANAVVEAAVLTWDLPIKQDEVI